VYVSVDPTAEGTHCMPASVCNAPCSMGETLFNVLGVCSAVYRWGDGVYCEGA